MTMTQKPWVSILRHVLDLSFRDIILPLYGKPIFGVSMLPSNLQCTRT